MLDPRHVRAAADIHRWNTQVFLAPFWPEIFAHDAERKQDLAEAEATATIMAETYARLGYQILELPRVGIEGRADFVLDRIGGA